MNVPTQTDTDRHWMQLALGLAGRAGDGGEVPVGAVLVQGGTLIAEGWNQPIAGHDPTAHAEVMALRAAGRVLNNYRFTGSTLYVTLEPCLMCVGAIVHARVSRLVFAAHDPKSGAVESVCQAFDLPGLNHRVEVSGGLMAEECGALIRTFFRARRS